MLLNIITSQIVYEKVRQTTGLFEITRKKLFIPRINKLVNSICDLPMNFSSSFSVSLSSWYSSYLSAKVMCPSKSKPFFVTKRQPISSQCPHRRSDRMPLEVFFQVKLIVPFCVCFCSTATASLVLRFLWDSHFHGLSSTDRLMTNPVAPPSPCCGAWCYSGV